MKVWVYVEGLSDRLALERLWSPWRERLGNAGWGISLIPLASKSKFLRKIGSRAAEKLTASPDDLVVGLPDLYPNAEYRDGPFEHDELPELRGLQRREVLNALIRDQGMGRPQATLAVKRFLGSALKHDLEMLLLAAVHEMRDYLGTDEALDKWRHPVEDQNQDRPPKRIVEGLFLAKTRKSYRDTVHASAVLGRVTDIRTLILNERNQVECPVFKEMLDWIGERTSIPAY